MKKYKIKYKDVEFDASEYQNDIFNEIEYGVGNLVVNACAGSSKTTVIVNAMNLINSKKVLMIAFNRSIMEEIKSRVTSDSANVMTFHSLGYSFLKENLPNCPTEVNDFKYTNYVNSNIDHLSENARNINKNKYKLYINNIIKLIDYSRYYLSFNLKDIENISKMYGITPILDEIEVCQKVLKWGERNLESIDHTDMIWLPNVLNMRSRYHKYDWVLIDEAQDTSIAEQQLVERVFTRGTRFMALGDSCQQINVWCGSSDEAIDTFRNKPNTKSYPLPICYRCGKKIVDLAKKYSNNIIPSDNSIDGEINTDCSRYAPHSGDMVLCRTTAPLVELHLDYIRCNKASYIKGSENIKESYLSMISNFDCVYIDRHCNTSDGLFPLMYKKLFQKIENLMAYTNMEFDDCLIHSSVVYDYDIILGLKVLSEGLTKVDELRDKIDIIFKYNDENCIQLSTVHKSKGLECDNVFILHPSLMPSKLARKDWEIKTENNLIYVAITRAKKTLNFIKENTNYHSTSYFDEKKLKEDIEYVKRKLNYAEKELKSEKNVTEEYTVQSVFVKKLGSNDDVVKTNSEIKKSNSKGLNRFLNMLD